MRGRVDDRDEEQQSAEDTLAPNVQSSATKVGDQPPGQSSSHKGHASTADSQLECATIIHASLFEEIRGGIGERAARQNLTEEGHTADFRAAQVNTLEAVPVRGAGLNLGLEFGRVDHHGQLAVDLFLSLVPSQTTDAVLSVLQTIVAHQVPGALGRQPAHGHQRDGPDPLQSEWDAVRPLIGPIHQSIEYTRCDQLADGPAHVDKDGEVTTEVGWANLRGIGRSNRRKHAPGQTTENLTNEQDGGRVGEKDDEDERSQESQSDDHDHAITKLAGKVAVEEAT